MDVAALARHAWAGPATLVGLALAVVALAFGATVRRHAGVIEVTLVRRTGESLRAHPSFPFAAITFGHVVIARTADDHARLRSHERVHVAQYERWGAMFLVAYPAESAYQWLRGRRPYLDNRFEVEARRVASVAAFADGEPTGGRAFPPSTGKSTPPSPARSAPPTAPD
jgi:hypothetical protein